MEIKPFKIQVTSEQSRIVQQTLFGNGYRWAGEKGKNIDCLNKPYLYWENLLKHGSIKDNFIEDRLPELTFQEFFDTYVKWCIRGGKELAHWERTTMKGACDAFLNHPDYYYVPKSDSLLFWNVHDKIPENHIKITFEQFEKYVLKTKEDKIMEKKIIGYKLKEDCKQYKKAIQKISCCDIFPEIRGYYSIEDNPQSIRNFQEADLLDLWFEPVYEETSKELYFGKVKFIINKGDNFATTEYGKVTKEEIKNAIHYIENPPKLTGNTLSIHYNSTYCKITDLDNNGTLSYGFGCQAGSLKELKEIYNAFE